MGLAELYSPPEHDVTVSVVRGVATLEGTVQYESDVRIARDLVAAFDGVVDVDNRITCREKDPTRASVRWGTSVG